MDGVRFDSLTRSLHALTSRRATWRAAAGGIVATLGGAGHAAAACKTQGQECKKDRNCCSGLCSNKKKCECRSLGKSCDKDKNCCEFPAGLICRGTPDKCCIFDGRPCTKDADCCNEDCFEGVCAD